MRIRTSAAIAVAALVTAASTAPALAAPSGLCERVARRLPPLAPAQFEDGPTIAKIDLVSDFDDWLSGLRALNPDLSIRSDPTALNQKAAEVRRSLTGPMNRRVAWEHFALLNPLFADGHGGIQMPDYREALQAHIGAGGHIVPVEVRFGPDGALRVFAVAPGAAGVEPGDQVEAIDGHPTSAMVREMLRRSIGDTDLFRHAWVARRFAMLYGLLYGDTGQYDLTIRSAASGCLLRVRLAGATTLPVALKPEQDARNVFGWRILEDGVGYLRADGFDPPYRDALAAVAKEAFTAFKRSHIRALIVDVRENGGGDDPLWQQSLMEYITTEPYAQLSSYVQRITKANADPGDIIGTVKRGEYRGRFKPTADNPIRFSGPVYILDGSYSYSAAIQFLVAAQDFGIAKIAGAETGALSCSTGQVTRIAMPKTGLSATTPLIAYTRPSGVGCNRGVIPDVAVAINEVEPDKTLDALVVRIRSLASARLGG